MRFYINLPLTLGETINLPDDVYHHWCKVLRAGKGDTAVLFNGQGGEYQAVLTHIDKKSAQVLVQDFYSQNRTNPYTLTLIQAISKGERMDYTIQKACELGVSAIQLIVSERSERLRYERDQKKMQHWQGVAIAACEQCGMNIIPHLLPPIPLEDYLPLDNSELKLILTPSTPSTAFNPQQLLQSDFPKSISILVGAEGGLTTNEVTRAQTHGFLPWTIGERILRTETAGIIAMTGLATLHRLSPPS